MSEVRLTKAKTLELDPNRKYLIQVKEGTLTEEDTHYLSKQLEKMGIKNVLIVRIPKGKSLKIIEQGKKETKK